MDILPRLDTITQDQIQQVIDGHSDYQDAFLFLDPRNHCYNSGDAIRHSSDERYGVLKNLYDSLINEARHPHSHASQIDNILSGLIRCSLCSPKLPSDIITDTQHLLRRLPVYSFILPERWPWLDPEYSQSNEDTGDPWQILTINNTCSLNIVRIAIYINTHPTDMRGVRDLLLFLEQVLTVASQRDSGDQVGFIVRAALWTSWQRINMLYLFAVVTKGIYLGFGACDGAELASREFEIGPRYSVQDMSKSYPFHDKSLYMCSWAFELLKKEPCCIGADFQRFHERFNSAWGQQPGRCRDEQGRLSYCRNEECRRLTGLKVEDQSAHDEGCSMNCRRLIWDEKSYLSVKGTRAVSVTRTNAESGMQYCSASSRSVAISHVWSHGLGGRPEDGINECLHKRFSKIAARYNCESYWWDTACIPEPHQLRKEAIRGINRTFATSKVVLVCDQDIMKIDTSEYTIQKKEIILVTVLVSDWNVRAWTYLESMRGRNHLYLLCRHNACINFLELVKDVCSEGCIDIAILSLAARHMLPWNANSPPLIRDKNMGLELAGSMLSHRPASRKGDDLVIWSLLIGLDNESSTALPFEGVEQDSEEFCSRFWKTFVNRNISTGFLVSSAPRLATRGLTWAPRTTSCVTSGNEPPVHSSFDGTNTSLARITDQGIVGDWMMYEFSVQDVRTSPLTAFSAPNLRRLKDICKERFEDNCSRGALIHPVTDDSKSSVASLIEPVTGARNLPVAKDAELYDDLEYRGYRSEFGGTLLALLSKEEHHDENGLGWAWKGVWKWSDSVGFPPFKHVRDVFIR